jgi:ATP-binding cassette subfamily F protein 3
MITISASDITKAYGTDVILDKVTFHVDKGDKVGIIGVNGAGKTTLLDIVSGRDQADSGNIYISADTTIGYLRQHDPFSNEGTVRSEVEKIYSGFDKMEKQLSDLSAKMADLAADGKADTDEYRKTAEQYGTLQDEFTNKGGFSWRSEMNGILNSMAFGEEYYEKKISSLSGGERTRLALACLLMKKPDVLLLDEPTNHLDIGMLKWLEQYLASYSGTVILVSHDRYFLDHMTIFEIENRKMTCFTGNYSDFAAKKRAMREADLRQYNKQAAEIKRQEDIIRRFKERGTEHLAKRAASREKQLASMKRIEKPENGPGSMKLHFRQNYRSGNDVLFGEDICKSFGTGSERREIFRDVSFDIKRGERVCIVGANGVGKTTLLKIMMGRISASDGYMRTGTNVDFGYYDQRQEQLDPSNTVLDEVHDSFRLYKDSEIRGFLGRFLFTNDDVFKQVGSLSGGEKARLSLLKLMMSGANTLMLDEPTNHLDIDSKEILEDALKEYPGTIIAISHDRYFLNKVATKIYELSPDGITKYEGGYDYYEEKKASIESGRQYVRDLASEEEESLEAGSAAENSAAGPEGSDASGASDADSGHRAGSAEERQLKKKQQAEERRSERRRAALEEMITDLEEQVEDIQKKMCDESVLSDTAKLMKLDSELRSLKAKLDAAYDEWAELG